MFSNPYVFVGIAVSSLFRSYGTYKEYGLKKGIEDLGRSAITLPLLFYTFSNAEGIIDTCVAFTVLAVLSSIYDSIFPPAVEGKDGVMLGFGLASALIGLMAYMQYY